MTDQSQARSLRSVLAQRTSTSHDIGRGLEDWARNKFSMPDLVYAYWALFWLMNGLDKFLNRTALYLPGQESALVAWYGKDRTQQFTTYLERVNLDPAFVANLLDVIGILEVAIGLVLVLAVLRHRKDPRWAQLGLKLTVVTFIAFTFADVIIGDRAELLEHSTYIVLALVSWFVVTPAAEKSADSVIS